MALTFAQGTLAPLTCQFVTVSGMPVDVPDATIQILSGGTIILDSTPMIGPVYTGFYFYDFLIPNSLPLGNYTIRYSGTILGTPAAITETLTVVAPGTPAAGMSARQLVLATALEVYLSCAQHIPVTFELGRKNKAGDEIKFTFPRWNLTDPIIKRNNQIITDGFAIDYDSGIVRFAAPLHSTDAVYATYNFRWFSSTDLLRFLSDALNQINLEPPGTVFNLDSVPDQYVGVLMLGATKNAIKTLMMCLMFQQPSVVFGGEDRAKAMFDQMSRLKENNEKEFERDKKQIKKAQYPKIATIVTPEYTLPGGRCLIPTTKCEFIVDGQPMSATMGWAHSAFEAGRELMVMARWNGIPSFVPVSKIWKSDEDKIIYRLNTERGAIVECSGEHLFKINGGDVPIAEARPGARLITSDGEDEVASVKETIRRASMYDMEVPLSQNFFANGVLCHNSRWFRYLYSSNIG